MLKPAVIILLCAVSAGWLAGRAWDRMQGAGNVVPAREDGDRSVRQRGRAGESGPKLGPEQIIALMKRREEAAVAPGFSPLAEDLAEWTDVEIVAALEESIKDPALHSVPDLEGNSTTFLLQEWLKRDEKAVTEWFGKLDSMQLKGQLSGIMVETFLPDRLDKGFAFLTANRDVYRFGLEEGFVRQAFKCAADRGPDAVNAMLRMMREGNLSVPDAYADVPPDFDFQALAAAGELKTALRTGAATPVLRAWERKDRDAAYQWTMENAGGGGVGDILLGRRGEGGPRDVAWSAARYEEMDAEQRKAFVESARHFMTRDMEWIPQFSAAIQDPVLREELRLRGVQGLFNGRNYLAERLLEALGPPERRLEILENLVRDPQVTPPMPVNEERLRKKLGAWTQDQSRIDAIINHLKS